MLKENKNSSVSRTREIKAAVRAYKTASAEILKNGGAGALSRAASLCPVLCTGARSASKNISAHASLPFFKGAEEEAFSLAEAFLESGEKANEQGLCAFLALKGKLYGSITLSLLPDALFAAIFLRIARLTAGGEEEGLSALIFAAESLHFIDFSRVFLAFSSVASIFSEENAAVFKHCDEKTKFKYISALLSLCKSEGRGAEEMACELVRTANVRGVHAGELLFKKRAYVPRVYALCLAFISLLVTAVYFFACGRSVFALATAPAALFACYGMVKEILSVCFKYAGSDGLMRMSAERAKGEKAVVAIMSIITGRESDGELFERLENFYLSEENPNRFYAIDRKSTRLNSSH